MFKERRTGRKNTDKGEPFKATWIIQEQMKENNKTARRAYKLLEVKKK